MKHFYQSVPGNFTFPDFYTWLAKQLPKGVPTRGVEVGVKHGQSAAYLAVELINNNVQCKIDLVDLVPKESYLGYLEPVKQLIGKCREHKNSWDWGHEYTDGSLDFAFLDGDHSHEGLKKDIAAWLPKVKKGGIIAGHDFCLADAGVISAVIDSFEHFEIWRGCHWADAPQLAPHQKDWYFPVWSVKI